MHISLLLRSITFATISIACGSSIVNGQSLTSVNRLSPVYSHKAPAEIKSLKIGDAVPDIKIDGVINHSDSSINITDFNDKLLIIDFWESWCSSCVAALPKLQKLQEEYQDQVQVITVTRYDSKQQMTKHLSYNKQLKKFSLPTVIHDKVLHKYFPFVSVSHVIWIYKGVVIGQTGSEHFTSAFVKEALAGMASRWPVKNDLLSFDYKKPLLSYTNRELVKPRLLFYSALTGALEGVHFSADRIVDSAQNSITYNYLNVPLIDLCKGAIKGDISGDYDLKEVKFNVSNTNKFDTDNNTNSFYWTAKNTSSNTFCYSISLPLTLSAIERKRAISRDLHHWLSVGLGINVSQGPLPTPCLIIRRKLNTNLTPLKEKAVGEQIVVSDKDVHFINMSVQDIIVHLNNNERNLPFIYNESGVPDSLKFTLILSVPALSNFNDFKKDMERQGFDVQLEQRERMMYIISE
ncbi:thioredoxin family protein [Pseudoflavitalea sp. X16]|uniref:TlpA family protein disulfide reductase n=1 Tax=Paraflavitalea devenefica TaxID=2716334 RepID=UPI0014230F70|nr:thioredoxin family protein [Paraflavitalea devenefica]NII26720.1 thioredoxin family protein [Paraflavitalea devenefica]